MPTYEFELDSNGNPILPPEQPPTALLPTPREFRIVPSPDEASLHPRALWEYWKKYMFWDHRTYYGFLELLSGLVVALSSSGINSSYQKGFLTQKLVQAVLILAGVMPIHWYSNHRLSKHVLTKALSHISVLSSLLALTVTFQIVNLKCDGDIWGDSCGPEPSEFVHLILWLTVPVFVFAISVIWRNSRIPARDLLPTQLPSSVGAEEGLEIDDEVTMAWASANVADGIEDDSLEPEGHVRLR